MPLRVIMHEAFTEQDVKAARAAALSFDADAEVSANYMTKALEPVLLIIVFVAGGFGTGFFNKAGADAYDALKGLVQRLRTDLEARSQILVEDEVGLQLVLGPATPAEALLQLPEDVAQAAAESGQLFWDDEAECWRSPL